MLYLPMGASVFSSSRYANVPGKKAKNNMAINVRLIMALRNLGIGYDGLQHFCMTLNMNKPMTRNNYNTTVNSLHESYMAEVEQSMKIAAEEVKAKEQSADIAACFDGSLQKPILLFW